MAKSQIKLFAGKEAPPDPGVYEGIPAEVYHSWGAVSSSMLTAMHRSPAHARWFLDYGFQPTAAMQTGTAVHVAVLEPELFHQRYEVQPKGLDLRTKAGKEARAAVEASGKTFLPEADWWLCRHVNETIEATPSLSSLFIETLGKNEVSFVWVDEDSGLPCKARADRWLTQKNVLVDLKTTISAKPRDFTRSADRYGYFRQAAHYTTGAQACLGWDFDFQIVAIEKGPPHVVVPFLMSDAALEAGHRERRAAIDALVICDAMGRWPGYADGETVNLEPPERRDHDEDE